MEDSPSPVYGAALLMRFGSDPIRGSNPRSSARLCSRAFGPLPLSLYLPGGTTPRAPRCGLSPANQVAAQGPRTRLAGYRPQGRGGGSGCSDDDLTDVIGGGPGRLGRDRGEYGSRGALSWGASKCPRSWSKAAWQRRNGIRSPAEAASAGWPLADGPGCCGRGYGLNFQLDHATAMFAYSTNNVAREAFFPVHAARQDGARPEASGRWRSPS
jgi:hypothetical protein